MRVMGVGVGELVGWSVVISVIADERSRALAQNCLEWSIRVRNPARFGGRRINLFNIYSSD